MDFNYRLNLKKASTGIGFYVFSITSTMFLISIVMSVMSMAVNNRTDNTAILLIDIIVSITSMFVIGIFYCMLSNTSLNEVLPLKKVRVQLLIPCVLIAFAVGFVSDYFTEIFVNGVSLFGLHNNSEMSFKSNGTLENILYIISVAVIPPIAEEFAFRGIVLQKLRKYGDSFAVLISALLFGLLHGNIVQIPFAFIVGLVLAFITVKTESIIPAMITHFLINCSSVVVSLIEENNYADINITDTVYLFFIILIIIAGIVSAYKLSKDKKFFTLNKYTLLSFKERVSALFSSVGIIFALSLIVVEIIISLIPYGS
jgi:membrane protease YdiL (CAAX protease family)